MSGMKERKKTFNHFRGKREKLSANGSCTTRGEREVLKEGLGKRGLSNSLNNGYERKDIPPLNNKGNSTTEVFFRPIL